MYRGVHHHIISPVLLVLSTFVKVWSKENDAHFFAVAICRHSTVDFRKQLYYFRYRTLLRWLRIYGNLPPRIRAMLVYTDLLSSFFCRVMHAR